ncbi:MAG: RNA pseudouridine synthase, partial [Alphaproteobacteria bacterium]|nr:RNA pseudouridine synthase [Alphaproteobacteria bacterium]MBX9976855.1 RNA pseudouridine synthase [Alphaproteobacteria bacterium]
MEERFFTVETEESKIRLDKYLAGVVSDLTRSRIQALIGSGHVQVDGQEQSSCSFALRGGESVSLKIPPPEE